MDLAELLEYTAKEYLDDRTDLIDGDSDNLWSDSFLVRQFNQAQKILARRAWCIIDVGHPQAGTIVLRTGVATYKVHHTVLRVFDGTPTTQLAPLGRTEDVLLRDPSWIYADAFAIGEAASLAGLTGVTPGVPLAIATDAGTNLVRVYPTPAADQNGLRVLFKVARLPYKDLTLEDMEACPEVPEAYHLDICEYAAGKALTLPNIDSADKATGRALLDKFDELVMEARRDRQRAEWSGARWGFSSTTALVR